MLKIVLWNVGGLEGQTKRRLVKEVLRQENPDVVISMETKRSEFCSWRIASIWKRRRVEWEVLEAKGLSSGILALWNLRLCVAIEVVHGRHSITIAFLDGDGEELWIIGVYGPPRISGRNLFWEELRDLLGHCGSR